MSTFSITSTNVLRLGILRIMSYSDGITISTELSSCESATISEISSSSTRRLIGVSPLVVQLYSARLVTTMRRSNSCLREMVITPVFLSNIFSATWEKKTILSPYCLKVDRNCSLSVTLKKSSSVERIISSSSTDTGVGLDCPLVSRVYSIMLYTVIQSSFLLSCIRYAFMIWRMKLSLASLGCLAKSSTKSMSCSPSDRSTETKFFCSGDCERRRVSIDCISTRSLKSYDTFFLVMSNELSTFPNGASCGSTPSILVSLL
mmetsp:Transcript_8252/g.30494  ORF Transcript_8252/g.30494 Transcript_8252/m.30494 type:complete len:261 (+) Transcript_8252:3293-4075(+)